MRNLARNQRDLYYATKARTESIVDDYGNDTLEVRTIFNAPLSLRGNISSNAGEEAINVFGAQTEYSRVLCLAGAKSPMAEGDKVWFGVVPADGGSNNNYVVAKVADSKNGVLIALREVSNRG